MLMPIPEKHKVAFIDTIKNRCDREKLTSQGKSSAGFPMPHNVIKKICVYICIKAGGKIPKKDIILNMKMIKCYYFSKSEI